jgi:predicted transcriptional regulator
MTFQDSLGLIAMDDEGMTGQTLKVMLLLMGNLEFENYIVIRQSAIAEHLKMHGSIVSKAIGVLVDKGIILRIKDGTTTGYKLNLNYGNDEREKNMTNIKNQIARYKMIDMHAES